MQKKLLIALALAAIVPFGLVACGDDEEDSGGSDSAETTETDTGGAESGGSGEAGTVSISAAEDGSLAYNEDSVETKAGTVTIAFDNQSSTPHDVRVEGSGEDLGGTDVVTGESTTAEVELEAGDYTFFCSVSGHRDAGMEGDLTAE